jgi:hypothetical protein
LQRLCEPVDSGVVPGLNGYANRTPAGWISLGPCEDCVKLARSRIMRPVDDRRSVACRHGAYVARRHRSGDVTASLAAAVHYAREQQVQILRPIRTISHPWIILRVAISVRAWVLHRGRRPPADPSSHAPRAPFRLGRGSESPGLLDVSVVGCQAVRLGVRLVDSERDDPPRMDPDQRAAFGGECLGHAADLQTSHAPRLN